MYISVFLYICIINPTKDLFCYLWRLNYLSLLVIRNLKKCYQVVELAPLGSLLNYLRKWNKHSVVTLHEYGVQISSGMAYLQNMKLVHRDLAARNIFMKDKYQVKISKFKFDSLKFKKT